MKTFLILAILLFLLPVKADVLLDIMNGKYMNYSYSEEKQQEEIYEEDSSENNGEHYSWDNLYLCSYCYETEVIINPYSLDNDVGIDY